MCIIIKSQQVRRAGFREGVKMALDRGVKPTKEEFLNGLLKNLHRLWIWLMVAPFKNGNWAILCPRRIKYDNAFRLGLC